MSGSTERLLRPGSTTGTVLSIVTFLLLFVLALLLVSTGVVRRPTVSDRSLAVFVLGGAVGVATTVLTHRSPTFRRSWSRFSVRFGVILVVVMLAMTLLFTETVARTTLLVWLFGLLPAAAATRLLLYLRYRGVE